VTQFRSAFQVDANAGPHTHYLKEYTGAPGRASSWSLWLLLIASCAPTVNIFIGGTKWTIARFAILFLLIPALTILMRKNRHPVISDWFGFMLAGWMVGATTIIEGFNSSVYAEVLEFLGAYVVARAYVFGPFRVSIFIGILRAIVFTLVALAILETLSGRNITQEAVSTILPGVGPTNAYRMGLVRASSTFDGSTQFGTFCSALAAIFLYSEYKLTDRFMYVGLAALGCVLSLSSAPLMGLVFVISGYSYDRLLQRYSARWTLGLVLAAGSFLALFLVSSDPISFIIGHFTFDPSDGWFRLNTWSHATHNIALSPWMGYSFTLYGDLDDYWDQASVDCVWLVVGLRFGLPAVALLVLTNLGSISRFRCIHDPYMDKMATGFTLAIVALMFVGVTVHYWNGPWILWGMFIGVRASLKEYALAVTKNYRGGADKRMNGGRSKLRRSMAQANNAS
jgi:hypothetical protein